MSAAEHYITAMAPDGDGNIVAACVCGYVLFESAYLLPRAFQEHTRGMR